MSDNPTPELPTPKTIEEHTKLLDEVFAWAKEMEKPEGWTVLAVAIPNVQMWERPCTVGNMVKSVTEFKAPANQVVTKLLDRSFRFEPDLLEFKLVEQVSDTIEVESSRWKVTWPVYPREFVNTRTVRKEGEKTLIARTSVNSDKAKFDSSYVRGVAKSVLTIEPKEGGICRLTRLLWIDPKGWIPGAVVSTKKKDDGFRLVLFTEAFNKSVSK